MFALDGMQWNTVSAEGQQSPTCMLTQGACKPDVVIVEWQQETKNGSLKHVDRRQQTISTACLVSMTVQCPACPSALDRSVRQVSASFLEAPWGCAVIVFMYATGISSLRAYDAELTARALELYESTAAGKWLLGAERKGVRQ
jgi:hypothetical protein